MFLLLIIVGPALRCILHALITRGQGVQPLLLCLQHTSVQIPSARHFCQATSPLEHTVTQLRGSGRTIIDGHDIPEFWGYAQDHQPPSH